MTLNENKGVTLNDYQKQARQTAAYPVDHSPVYAELGTLSYLMLGLCSEAGECASKVKKALRDTGGVLSESAREALLDELGDVLWYVAEAASALGESLDDVAYRNVAKLVSRAERGTLHGDGDTR